jgi:hypothetical protein
MDMFSIPVVYFSFECPLEGLKFGQDLEKVDSSAYVCRDETISSKVSSLCA